MNAKALRRAALTLSGMFGPALVSVVGGCGSTAAETSDDVSAVSSAGEVSSPATGARSDAAEELVAGGMDSGDSLRDPQPWWNESPTGPVSTTLGDFVVGVRSEPAVYHSFQEAHPGARESLTVTYQLRTADRRVVWFELEYGGEGVRSFQLQDDGFLSLRRDDRELLARSGAVTIEPVGTDAIKISFDKVTVAPEDDPGSPELIGSGVVEGPLRRICRRADDVLTAELNGVKPLTPPPVHDEAWINRFCSGS